MEPDRNVIAFLQTFGEYQAVLHKRAVGEYKCDSCGQLFQKLAVCRPVSDPEKTCYICMGECGKLFFGKQYGAVAQFRISKGLSPATPELAKETKEAEQALAEATSYRYTAEAIERLVKQTKKYKMAGFGRTWRRDFLSSVLGYYHRNHRLTRNQADALYKFCKHCEREAK